MDKVFAELEKWSEAQQQVYNTFVTNDTSVISVPRQSGASSVIAGIAVAQAACGKQVLILEPTYMKYTEMWQLLKHYAQRITSDYAFSENSAKFYFYDGTIECRFQNTGYLQMSSTVWHSILIDNAQDMGTELFFKSIIPVMQLCDIQFLAIGCPNKETDCPDLLSELQKLPKEFICKIAVTDAYPHWAYWLNKAKARAMKQRCNM
jgi:hypothetical protein